MSDSGGLADVAGTDDRAALLRALRADLAEAYLAAPPAYKAALAKQLRDTVSDLATLPVSQEGSPADEIARRRAARRAGPAGKARAARPG